MPSDARGFSTSKSMKREEGHAFRPRRKAKVRGAGNSRHGRDPVGKSRGLPMRNEFTRARVPGFFAGVSKPKSSAGCIYPFFAVFVVAGIAMMVAAVRGFRRGEDWHAMLGMAGAGLVFTVAGGGFGALVWRGTRQGRDEAQRREQFPSEPWKWRAAWTGGAIEADRSQGAAMFWIFAVVWNAMSFPAAIGAWQKAGAGQKFLVIVAIFPLIGLGLLWSAIYRTLQARKYGRAVFLPASLPGEIGGTLGGVIQVPKAIVPEEDARLTLRCIQRSASGSGDSRTVRENVLWEKEVRLAREKWHSGPAGTQIPVLLPIAAGCRPTELTGDNDNRVLWRLAISAKTPGVDFSTAFEVPVFATGNPSAALGAADTPMLEEYRREALDDDALAKAGVRCEADGFVFTSSHLGGMRAWTAIFAAGLVALEIYLFMVHGPAVLLVVLGIFAGIAVLAGHDLWSGDLEVRVAGEEAIVKKRGGFGGREVRVRRADVAEIVPTKSMGVGEREYFRLKMIGTKGVDPRNAAPGEPFAARKLRFQLRQAMKELGVTDPANAAGAGRDILAQMKLTPKFEIMIARNVPGLANAEAVAAQVLALIRGK
jgi:hypothetical protein